MTYSLLSTHVREDVALLVAVSSLYKDEATTFLALHGYFGKAYSDVTTIAKRLRITPAGVRARKIHLVKRVLREQRRLIATDSERLYCSLEEAVNALDYCMPDHSWRLNYRKEKAETPHPRPPRKPRSAASPTRKVFSHVLHHIEETSTPYFLGNITLEELRYIYDGSATYASLLISAKSIEHMIKHKWQLRYLDRPLSVATLRAYGFNL